MKKMMMMMVYAVKQDDTCTRFTMRFFTDSSSEHTLGEHRQERACCKTHIRHNRNITSFSSSSSSSSSSSYYTISSKLFTTAEDVEAPQRNGVLVKFFAKNK